MYLAVAAVFKQRYLKPKLLVVDEPGYLPIDKLGTDFAALAALQHAAARLAISEGHARQRLQDIYHKTDTSRQGELVALLAKLSR
jgi:hypothetical protein